MILTRPNTFVPLLASSLSLGVLLTFSMVSSARVSGRRQSGLLSPFTQTLPGSVVKIDMVAIPGGSITVAGKSIKLKPFWIAKTETPWEAYDVFLASGPPSPPYDQSKFKPDAIARPSKSYILPDLGWGHHGFPAINLSSTSVEMFCRWLSKATGKKYRVPTEAEWEFAARGGATGPIRMDKAELDKSAWHAGNSRDTTHAIGKKAPNKFGLYDIFGNTGEWATDLAGKPVVCGTSFLDDAKVDLMKRSYFNPKWQETDPQMPKSRWWLADAPFCGFRIICEP